MIQIKDLTVIYDQDIVALNHIDLCIKEHQCIAIIGKNGSGKSTLLQTLVGVVEAQGDIMIQDILLNKETIGEIRNLVGLVFQNPDHQLFMSTIYDDLAFGLINQGLSSEEIHERILRISEQLHIEHLLKRSCHKLSGGQKRMVAIATVLIMNPKIILMDEPSSFLDPMSRRQMIHMVKELKQTIIIATHDLDMALDLADEVILLNDGHIVAQDKTEIILRNQQLLEDNGLELPYCYQR